MNSLTFQIQTENPEFSTTKNTTIGNDLQVLLVGLNHKTAPLSIREQFAFRDDDISVLIPTFLECAQEVSVLSTCNRTEIYCVTENVENSAKFIISCLKTHSQNSSNEVDGYLYTKIGSDAALHLFKVAAGLDSFIIGETEILGQVRDSLSSSYNYGGMKNSLSGLFHRAIRAGRRVRNETNIARNPLSVSSAGVQLAQQLLGPLQDMSVLLVGAGDAGQLVARSLKSAGVSKIIISNRTYGKAEELAKILGGVAIEFSEIGSYLRSCNILISATDARDFIIGHKVIDSVFSERTEDLFIFDLAMPRDVDPVLSELKNIHLFNMDDLSDIAQDNLDLRKQSSSKAELVITQELTKFTEWWATLDTASLVLALRKESDNIRERELLKTLRKLPGLDDESRKVLEALTHSIVNALLHNPTEYLKKNSSTDDIVIFKKLFQIEDGPES